MTLKAKFVACLLFLALATPSVLRSQQADTQLSPESSTLQVDLQTALDIALSENPSVKVADMEITKKQYANRAAYGALMPQMDLIGQYQRAIKRQTVYFDGGMSSMFGGGDVDPSEYTPEELQIMQVLGKLMAPDPDAADEGMQMGRMNVYTAGLNVSLPLVVPALWKNIQMTEVDIEVAMEKARASRLDLANQTKKAFYSLLLAKDSYDMFKKTYANDSLNLVNIRNRYNQGIVAEYDVVTADVRLKSLIPNILQSENMMKIAELQLKMLMGIDSEVPIQVIGALSDYEQTMYEVIVPEDSLLQDNSDLRQFDLGNKQAELGLKIQKSQFLPTLTSTFNYMYNSQNNDFKFKNYRWDPYSTLGITLAIPLFSGGQRYYGVKQTEVQLLQMAEQRKDVVRGLNLAVKNSFDLMNKSKEQVAASKTAVEQAQKGYLITQKRYETGMGTIVDLNAASLAVTSAELQFRNAIYEYLSAKSDLEKVLGYDIETYQSEINK